VLQRGALAPNGEAQGWQDVLVSRRLMQSRVCQCCGVHRRLPGSGWGGSTGGCQGGVCHALFSGT